MDSTNSATDALVRSFAALSCILAGKNLPRPDVNSYSFADDVTAIWSFDLDIRDGDDALADQKAAAEDVVSTLGGEWTTRSDDEKSVWEQRHDGVTLRVRISRAAVCERVVVGTREVEVVEWRCVDPIAALDAEAVAS